MSMQSTPIGVFWDIENCSVPKWKSALTVVQVIRDHFFNGHREAEFMCVCDTTKEKKQVIQELNSAQVNVVHIDALSKNAADDKLKQSLRRFSDIHPAPATIILISSDINFASELSDLRHRKNYYIILIHSQHVHQALVVCANEHHIFEDLVKDLPYRELNKQSIEGKTDLEIKGFSPETPEKKINNRLRKLSTNCGGKVITIKKEYAVIRFPSSNDAEKAKKRMDGETVYGSKIQVDFSITQKPDSPGISANIQQKGSSDGKKKFLHMRPKSDPQVFKMEQSNGIFKSALEQVKNTQRALSEERPRPPSQQQQQQQQKQQQQQQQNQQPNKTQSQKYPAVQSQSPVQLPNRLQSDNRKWSPQQRQRTKSTEKKMYYNTGQQEQGTCQQNGTKPKHSAPHGNSPVDKVAVRRETTPVSLDAVGHPELQQVVDKFSKDNKSSRQVLMLQQQLFQEGHEQSLHDYNVESSQQKFPYALSNADSFVSGSYTRTNYTYQAYENLNKSFSEFGHHNNSYAYAAYRSLFDGSTIKNKHYQNDSTCNYSSNTYSSLMQQHRQNHERHSPYNTQTNVTESSYQLLQNGRTSPAYLNYQNAFRPIQSPSPCPSSESVSPCDLDGLDWDSVTGPVELLVSNLDYNISAKEWRKILFTTFHPHVRVLNVHVKTQPDNTSIGMVKVPSIEEARFAISQFHRKKIGYKRIHVTLKSDDAQRAASSTRAEAIALLSEAKDNVLPLFKFIELFDKRYHRTISVAELYKMRDTIEIREQGGSGRMVYLASVQQEQQSEQENEDSEEILEQPACHLHCPEGSPVYAEAVNSCMLPNVKMALKTLAPQVHSLLQSHEGNMPLMSFPACYCAEFVPLPIAIQGGVPLEHLISCVPGIQIQVSKSGVKKVQWAENRPPSITDTSRMCSSPLLSQQLNQISREMIDLLRHSAHCRMPFSKFIPSYHHFFGRQCRVADYGYNRLKDLFEAIPHVLQVLGTGDRKLLTLSHRAQVRRFSTDLVKLLKLQPGRQMPLQDLQTSFSKMLNKPFDVTEYGVCYLDDLLSEVPTSTAVVMDDAGETVIVIPRKDQSPEEVERTKQFALEVVDLLKHNPQCRMPFNKFIPSYHHHFGRQCRVSDYGFTKLLDLFEAIPHVVDIEEEGEERLIHLTEPELRKILADQIVGLLKLQKNQWLPLHHLMSAFTCHYGFNIPLYDFNVDSEEELVSRMKHVLRVQMINRCKYVMLANRSETPKLAHQALQLLMDQSCGSLPLMELCSRYKSIYGEECDVNKIRNELLDFVQVIGDDESGVISLTSLQTFARDVRLLLQKHSKIYLPQFDKIYKDYFTVDIKPALYGCPTITSLIMKIPHVAKLMGKGINKYIELSDDLSGNLPGGSSDTETCITCRISPHRPGSDSQSSDSGVTDTNPDDEDNMLHNEVKSLRPKSVDLLAAPVPSAIPSPDLHPLEAQTQTDDLIHFTSATEIADMFYALSEEEKKGQKTPLCRTPTSELLQMAAQCLISHPPPVTKETTTKCPSSNQSAQATKFDSGGISMSADSAQDLMQLIQGGWWKVSPSQEEEIKNTMTLGKGATGTGKSATCPHNKGKESQEKSVAVTCTNEDVSDASEKSSSRTDSAASLTISESTVSKSSEKNGVKLVSKELTTVQTKVTDALIKQTAESPSPFKQESKGKQSSHISGKQDEAAGQHKPKNSACKKDKYLVQDSSLEQSDENTDSTLSAHADSTLSADSESIEVEAPGSYKTYVKEMARNKALTKGKSSSTPSSKHTQRQLTIPKTKLSHCTVADDSMSYEAMFQRDPPLDTSSVKSDSTLSEKSLESPKKSPRKTRIAAKFDLPMEMN